jgi:DNA-binding response OmpR family regulator
VALTAYAGREHRLRGSEAEYNEYVVKPVDAEVLASVVRSLASDSGPPMVEAG